VRGVVYALIDPRVGTPRYVGKTVQMPERRLAEHLRDARAGKNPARVYRWIRSLERDGVRPEILVIEHGPADLNDAERRCIRVFRDAGVDLVNHTEGGDGGATMTGRSLTPEQRHKVSLANRKESNPERARKISESKKRQWQDPEYRAKMTEAGRRGVRTWPSAQRRSQAATPCRE
jgi:hypothetical protein